MYLTALPARVLETVLGGPEGFIRSQRLGLMAVEASETTDPILQLLHTFEAFMKFACLERTARSCQALIRGRARAERG